MNNSEPNSTGSIHEMVKAWSTKPWLSITFCLLFTIIFLSYFFQLFALRFGEYYSNKNYHHDSRQPTCRSPFYSCLVVIFTLHLLSAFFNILPLIISENEDQFQGGNLLCKLLRFIQSFFIFFNTFSIVLFLTITYQCHHHRQQHDHAFNYLNIHHLDHQQQSHHTDEYDHLQPITPRTFQFSVKLLLVSFIAALFSLPQMLINMTSPDAVDAVQCGPAEQLYKYQLIYFGFFTANVILVPLLSAIIIFCRVVKSPIQPSDSNSSCRNTQWHSERMREIKIALLFALVHIVCWTPDSLSTLVMLNETDPYVLLNHGTTADVLQVLNILQYCIFPWLYFGLSFSQIQHGITHWKENRNRVRLRRSICESHGCGDTLVASTIDMNSIELTNEVDLKMRPSIGGIRMSIGCVSITDIGLSSALAAVAVGVPVNDPSALEAHSDYHNAIGLPPPHIPVQT